GTGRFLHEPGFSDADDSLSGRAIDRYRIGEMPAQGTCAGVVFVGKIQREDIRGACDKMGSKAFACLKICLRKVENNE
ncbi:MAG: hypothetical protein M1499_05970, partial [Firmicutes bacterium]|nr:hypothetical protein [Bacillota bacterium]